MQNTMTAPPLQGMANLLESQGRYGDTELVHMSQPEVRGLASLGRLTRNPETGLMEAFSIGGFFKDYVAPAALLNNTLPLCPRVGLLNVNSLIVLVGVHLKLLPSAKSKTPELPSSTMLALTALL